VWHEWWGGRGEPCVAESGGGGGGRGQRGSGGRGDRHRATSTTTEETYVERQHRECGTGRQGLNVLG
jgi:hypothetical protein